MSSRLLTFIFVILTQCPKILIWCFSINVSLFLYKAIEVLFKKAQDWFFLSPSFSQYQGGRNTCHTSCLLFQYMYKESTFGQASGKNWPQKCVYITQCVYYTSLQHNLFGVVINVYSGGGCSKLPLHSRHVSARKLTAEMELTAVC